jgi:hypothetical protein
MATPAETESPITGSVLFYESPEPLNVEAHGKLGVKRVEKPYSFAAASHMTPLTVTEFANASLSFPIIFVGDEKTPVAVLGLNPGENIYVDAEGGWDVGAYIPAFVRRYPFVLANDEGNQRMIVCIDRKSKLVAKGGELALFNDKGEPTEYTQNAIKFCDDFEVERRRTESFVKLLNDLELLEKKQSHFTPMLPNGQPGEPQLVAEFYGVSEEKLVALPAEKFTELRDNGALGQIYAHLLSLNGWDRLIAIASDKAVKSGKIPAPANA